MSHVLDQQLRDAETYCSEPVDPAAPSQVKQYMRLYVGEANPTQLTEPQVQAYTQALRAEEVVRQMELLMLETIFTGSYFEGQESALSWPYFDLIRECPIAEITAAKNQGDAASDKSDRMAEAQLKALESYCKTYQPVTTPSVRMAP